MMKQCKPVHRVLLNVECYVESDTEGQAIDFVVSDFRSRYSSSAPSLPYFLSPVITKAETSRK
jgi:hypothetical protein